MDNTFSQTPALKQLCTFKSLLIRISTLFNFFLFYHSLTIFIFYSEISSSFCELFGDEVTIFVSLIVDSILLQLLLFGILRKNPNVPEFGKLVKVPHRQLLALEIILPLYIGHLLLWCTMGRLTRFFQLFYYHIVLYLFVFKLSRSCLWYFLWELHVVSWSLPLSVIIYKLTLVPCEHYQLLRLGSFWFIVSIVPISLLYILLLPRHSQCRAQSTAISYQAWVANPNRMSLSISSILSGVLNIIWD